MFSKFKDKLLYILMFLPIIFIDYNAFSTDTYWLIRYGQMIRNNGFFTSIPMSVHNFHFIPQQWLTDIIMSIFYDAFGFFGTLIYVYITSFICILIFYNIMKLITENKTNSKAFTFIFAIPFCIMYSETRPQMISYICLLTLIYILEKYVKTNNFKLLLLMPFIFILQINSHATCYPFLIMICFAYIFNLKIFKTKNIVDDDYDKRKIAVMLFISTLCLFINPFPREMVTYIFRCSSASISEYLSFEMQPLTIKNYGIMVLLLFFVLFIIIYNFKENIKLRYLLLFIGGFGLCCLNIRSLIYFLIGYLIFVVSYMKKMDTEKFLQKVFGAYEIMIPIIIVVAIVVRIVNIKYFTLDDFSYRGTDYSTNGIVEAIYKDSSKENIRVYNFPFIGGYLQFNGFDVYMNSGLEPFLKSQNKEKDVIDEYLFLQFGRIDAKEFIDEYDFDYLILKTDDYLEEYAAKNLRLIYDNGDFTVYSCD